MPAAADRRAGYLLIELAVALAATALVLGLLFPNLPNRTTPTRLIGLVTASAALLRDARSAAIEHDAPIAATFDAVERILRVGNDRVEMPSDVDVTLEAGGNCPARDGRAAILFRPDGTNCGGVLRFASGGRVIRTRVNWVDGRIDVVEGG